MAKATPKRASSKGLDMGVYAELNQGLALAMLCTMLHRVVMAK